jgi:cytosine/adenosine deaminase-related metal-dependent hydrolase
VIVPYVADTMPFAPSLECNARLLETADKGDRVRVWVALHDLESCSDDLVREGAKLARGHGTGVHLHCSETRFPGLRARARHAQARREHRPRDRRRQGQQSP